MTDCPRGHGPEAPCHGTVTGYFNHGCRCDSCGPAGRAYHRKTYAANPQKFQERQTFRNFGLTHEQYDEMLAAQGGVCAICERPPGEKRFAIDHDHSCCSGRKTCGKCIRGLLCQRCNHALGLLGDDPDTLAKARAYVISKIT